MIIFQHINDLVTPGTVKLSNGIEVQRADWPTLIMAQIPIPGLDKPGTCTAALVGPNVVLLAAHCVDSWEGMARRAQLWAASRRITMVCEMHPEYLKRDYQIRAPRGSEDYALCMLEDSGKPALSFAGAIQYEVVDTQSALKTGDSVLMTGYGCDKLTLAANGVLDWVPRNDGLRIGDERIESAANQWSSDPAYVTTRSIDGREPALCPGDSGGPLFTGVTTGAPSGVRRIRGVNSKVCARRRGDTALCSVTLGPGVWDIVSSMSATGLDSFRSWAGAWATSNADKNPIICGINRSAGVAPCRD
jgi:hypothetical protein